MVRIGSLFTSASNIIIKIIIQGTVPASFFLLDALNIADISDGWLSGTLPETIDRAFSLQSFSVNNNSIHGTIPIGMVSQLGELGTSVDLGLNYMSCCGIGFNFTEGYSSVWYERYNLSAPRLPPGLALSSYLRPVAGDPFANNPPYQVNCKLPGCCILHVSNRIIA